MSDSTPSIPEAPASNGANREASREERLAARLRENLRRRKAQARALNGPETGMAESECEQASADGENAGLSKPATGR